MKKSKPGTGRPKVIFDATKAEIESQYIVELYKSQPAALKVARVEAALKTLRGLIGKEREFTDGDEQNLEANVSVLSRIRLWELLQTEMLQVMHSFHANDGAITSAAALHANATRLAACVVPKEGGDDRERMIITPVIEETIVRREAARCRELGSLQNEWGPLVQVLSKSAATGVEIGMSLIFGKRTEQDASKFQETLVYND